MELPEHLLTLDFETFWSADFTLKKLSIEEYVRSPEFKVFGAAVKYNDKPARWMNERELRQFFVQVPWKNVALLCQNAPFDALILSHLFGIKPAFYICTLAMARMMLPRQRHNLKLLSHMAGLPPKGDAVNLTKGLRDLPPLIEAQLGEYACGDADNTYGVFRWLLDMGFPIGELEIIDTTIRMFAVPQLGLDRQRARDLLAKVIRGKRSALRRLGVTREEVSSTDKFAALLDERFGIEVELKAGKPKADGTPRWLPALAKTDPFLKGLLEHENPDVQALAAIRLEVKSTLEETRLRRMLSMHTRGPMCVYLNFAGAHTFRWSGGDKMNWQNFTRGSELRKCVVAPKGYVMVVADLSQIEARMLNCLAEQWDVLELFEKGDPYSVLASKFFDRPVNKKDHPKDRHVGKVGELGLGYGMGAPKLRATLRVGALGGDPVHIDLDTAKAWVKTYRASHANVVAYWGQAETALQLLNARTHNAPWGPMVIHDGKIILPNGSRLDYTGLVREEGDWLMRDRSGKLMTNTFGAPIRLYGGLMTENVVQALARVVMSQAMPAIRARYPIVMSTHDELVCLAPEEEGQQCLDYMLACMTKRPSWLPRIPLAAEGGFDVCYSK
jgi:DNA polymerase